MEFVKKKRGRKPKNFIFDENDVEPEIHSKKKRGRKKKYEIENFDKINNRGHINNFNHNIVYSDDEDISHSDQKCVKKIAFGSLDITVSKQIPIVDTSEYRNQIIEKSKETSKSIINENEYSSDEEKVSEMVYERNYKENVKYVPGNLTDFTDCKKEQSIKKIRVVTTIKNVLQMEDWPEQTDICCWWCCHQFTNCPCTLPTKYDSIRKRFTFVGIFCSWNCTKAYNFSLSDSKKYERSCFITLLIQQMYGIVSAINIKHAPPRQTLKMFGGYMDISEFRDTKSPIDKYSMNELSYTYIYPEITEISNIKIKQEKKNLRLSRT